MGRQTAESVSACPTLELDLLAVRGKEEAERIFALLRGCEVPDGQNFQEFAVRHARMIETYRQGDWPAAKAALAECQACAPELAVIYNLYAQRISEYEQSKLPDKWTAVHHAKSK
jgi:adenylate cyclase